MMSSLTTLMMVLQRVGNVQSNAQALQQLLLLTQSPSGLQQHIF